MLRCGLCFRRAVCQNGEGHCGDHVALRRALQRRATEAQAALSLQHSGLHQRLRQPERLERQLISIIGQQRTERVERGLRCPDRGYGRVALLVARLIEVHRQHRFRRAVGIQNAVAQRVQQQAEVIPRYRAAVVQIAYGPIRPSGAGRHAGNIPHIQQRVAVHVAGGR